MKLLELRDKLTYIQRFLIFGLLYLVSNSEMLQLNDQYTESEIITGSAFTFARHLQLHQVVPSTSQVFDRELAPITRTVGARTTTGTIPMWVNPIRHPSSSLR